MKKLVILFAAAVLTAMNLNVFAQSTGTNPAPGAKHNYFITDNGNSVVWSVTKDDLTTPAGTDAVISSANAYSTDITWASSVTVGDWYYVHVIETDGTGCSNEKVLPVQITASPFYLTLAASATDQCYDGAVTASIDLGDPSIIHYDHGKATIVFTVTPTGLSGSYSGYSFDLSLTVPSGYDYTTTPVAFSSNVTDYTDGKVTVNDNAVVTITYTIDNTNDYTNTTDPNGSAADFTATATISNGVAINGVSDNAGGTYTDATNVARPHTTGIGTN